MFDFQWQMGMKDGLIFLIDCTKPMFKKNESDDSCFDVCIKVRFSLSIKFFLKMFKIQSAVVRPRHSVSIFRKTGVEYTFRSVHIDRFSGCSTVVLSRQLSHIFAALCL